MKKNVLIIGAGGVAKVALHKCAQHNDVLGDINIASRTLTKCQDLIAEVKAKKNLKVAGVLQAHQLDAFDVAATKDLIIKTNSKIVLNLGSSFINMSVLQACIETGVAYVDTAIHEEPNKVCETPPWYANYEWQRKQLCADNKITAVLGAGFDPGVVNAYAALAVQEYFDKVNSIDIIDINAGKHGRYFSTNFDPEINFREFTGRVWSWQNQQWQQNKMFEIKRSDDLPVVGMQTSYLTGHDELHSLSQILDVPNIRFWMGFSEHYINVFSVLQNLGMLSEHPVKTAEGLEVIPLKVTKAVLPDPASLAPDYVGHTWIGDVVKGTKDGVEKEVFIYNVVDHQTVYQEVASQAVSYTAGVPPVAAALLIANGQWDVEKMVNVEELPIKPFINLLNTMGIVTRIKDEAGDRLLSF